MPGTAGSTLAPGAWRATPFEDKRFRRRRARLGDAQGELGRGPRVFQRGQLAQQFVVAIEFALPEQLGAVACHDGGQIDRSRRPIGIFRQRSAGQAGPGPLQPQPKAPLALKIFQPELLPTGRQMNRRLLLVPQAMNAVINQHRLFSDPQAGAVVRVEIERVVPLDRHDQPGGEAKAECRLAGGRAQIEQMFGELADRFGFERVEIGETVEGVAIEAELDVLQIGRIDFAHRRRSVGLAVAGEQRRANLIDCLLESHAGPHRWPAADRSNSSRLLVSTKICRSTAGPSAAMPRMPLKNATIW